MRSAFTSIWMFGLLLFTSSCGAGLVTGALAGNSGSSQPPAARPPVLNMPEPRLPLQPASAANASARTVVLANLTVAANVNVRVQVQAAGIAVDQDAPVVLFGQTGSTVIGFQLRTQPFAEAFGTGADVPGTLVVLVDGREVAPALPVVLLRRPVASLLDASQVLRLSPLGGTRAELLVRGLRSQSNLQMLVTTPDATGQASSVTRLCSDLTVTAIDIETSMVAANVPGNTFTCPAQLVVEDLVAGRSSEVTNVTYRPEIDVVLPGQGPATGGALITLIGRALAPLDFTSQPPSADFDRVQLEFQKGDRRVVLAASELRRRDSSVDRLVFTMPPSPDGRAGSLDIILSVQSMPPPAIPVTVQTNLFLFASRAPVFGPRGAVLDVAPVALVPIKLENAQAQGAAPDFGVLNSQAGVGFLQLLAAQENGMFIRFGPPKRLGSPEVAAERGPSDLAAGDLDGDQVPDLFSLNVGAVTAEHAIVLGQQAPQQPLGVVRRLLTSGEFARCETADFDADGRLDLLLVPGIGAPAGQQPRVWLSRSALGEPQFVDMGPIDFRSYAYDAVEVADLDGDAALDVAVLTGGLQPRLDVAYGLSNGTFAVQTRMDLVISGYGPDPNSAAVGLHRIRGSARSSLAIVFSGLPPLPGQLPPNPLTPPVVAVLMQTEARQFTQSREGAAGDPGSILIVPLEPIGTTLAADLDHDNVEELMLGVRDTSSVPLGLLRFVPAVPGSSAHFVPVVNGIQQGSDPIRRITRMHFGVASPADLQVNRQAVNAVFVLHESETDGVSERRISTLLVFESGVPPDNGLTLLSADGGGPLAASLRGIALGNFRSVSVSADRGNAAARDLALATDGSPSIPPGVIVLGNDGFGGFAPSMTLDDARILPETIVRIPAPSGQIESLAYLDSAGHIAVWRPNSALPAQQSTTWRGSQDLRELSSDPRLRTAAIDATSIVQVADVDGDAVLDLVVLLRLVVPPPRTEGDALLIVLRGKAVVTNESLPFWPANFATPVHGNAVSIACGNFVPEPQAATSRMLEMAVAIPLGTQAGSVDGDHVRFYRIGTIAPPAATRWVRSFAPLGQQVLPAGNRPTRIVAADFDRSGVDDLLVATGDAQVMLFLNSGEPSAAANEVAIESFHPSFTSPVPSGPGQPVSLSLGDINSDGNVDALLTTQARSASNVLSASVAFYVSSGTGSLDGPNFVSRTRLGDRSAAISVALGDCNGDAVPDISAGWATFGVGDRNVRVLFGGSR
ncbi:MAG: VCBS repeat-containing protein [Planctomycetota bacterium]|nr:VCBS repeat-containing protein [Planctomycetota bacterium]